MAATDGQRKRRQRGPRVPGAASRPRRADAAPAGALLAAALALPGVMPSAAHAQSAPDKGIVELQYLNYRDWQPGRDRMQVHAPAFYALVPLNDTTVIEGGMVYDHMSGASPLYFNVLSGATVTISPGANSTSPTPLPSLASRCSRCRMPRSNYSLKKAPR